MPGHIARRTYKRTRADGTEVKREVWRARYPDPQRAPGSGAKIEQTFSTKRAAEQWLTRQQSAVQEGSHIDPRRGERPLAEIADAYRATWIDLEPKTVVGYESILRQHIIPRFGKTKVGAVSTAAIQQWVNELAKTRQPNTVHRVYGVLRGVLKVAVQHHYINANPCADVSLPSKRKPLNVPGKPRRHRQLYLTADELRALVTAMPAHYRTPTLVSGLCGLRAGELWALRRQDIDPLHGTMTVENAIKDIKGALEVGPTKTHARRKLTIPPVLRPQLEAALLATPTRPTRRRRRPDDPPMPAGYAAIKDGELCWTPDAQDRDRLVFVTPWGYPVSHLNFYRRTFRPAVAKLWPEPHRLAGLRWHDLRHTCASLSLAGTPNLHIVKERLGHDDIKTTINTYGHLLPSVDAALADALGAMYDATATPGSNVIELHEQAK